MRIVYLHQYFVTPEQSGGVRSFEFATRLASRGHEVHVVSTARTESRASQWETEQRNGLFVHRIAIPYSNEMAYARRVLAFAQFVLPAAAKTRAIRPDLIFATSTPLTIALPAIIAKLGKRIPMVFEVRDAWPDVPIQLDILRNPILQRSARILEHLAYASSAHVIALSPGMAQAVIASGYPSSQVGVIPNASDLQKSAVSTSIGSWRSEFSWAEEKKLIAYTGTLGYVNNPIYLAELSKAVSKLSDDIVFVVVGTGAQRELLERHAESIGVLGNVLQLLDPVPSECIPDILKDVEAGISTIRSEPILAANSANKFFNYLAAGRPVILNHGGWQAELLSEYAAGISVPGDDIDEAARQIVAFVGDHLALREAGQAARRLAEERFDREELFARFADILEGSAGLPRHETIWNTLRTLMAMRRSRNYLRAEQSEQLASRIA